MATDGAYSSGPTAPTSLKRALAKLMTEHLRLERAVASLSRSLLLALIPIFSDPIIARPSKMVGGAGQGIWKARTEGELSD